MKLDPAIKRYRVEKRAADRWHAAVMADAKREYEAALSVQTGRRKRGKVVGRGRARRAVEVLENS